MGRKNASRTQNRAYKQKVRAYNSRSRLFNGNVRAPGEFIFIWALILAYFVGMWIFLMNLGLNKRDYKEEELVFERFYRKNDSIVWVFSGGENLENTEYSSWASMTDLDAVLSLRGGERLSVTTAKSTLVSVEYQGKVILSREDVERDDAEGKRTVTIAFSVIAAVWAVYVGVSVYVMCNAHKLPKKLVHAFVKPSYIIEKPRK